MLTMFTALEARATSKLISPKDYSIYQHIEIRILDTVQHGGTYIIYAGEITDGVIRALELLDYDVLQLAFDDEIMYRISWEDKDAKDTGRTSENDS